MTNSATPGTPIPPDLTEADYFPRSRALPRQSPLFWVEQKDRYLRQLLIRDIEEISGRRLLVYFGNRFEASSSIESRDVAHMAELAGDAQGTPADLLIETNGGMTDAAESVISTLRSLVPDFRVIVANCAKSNGTLIALAASSILMGPTSELGPIEPSLGGIPCSILDTPKIAAENFPLHMMGQHALRQSSSLARTLLGRGMMKGRTQEEIDATVTALATRDRFPSHGSVVDHREAVTLGLSVIYLPPGDELWERLWLLYCMYDFDCRSRRYAKVFEGRGRSLALAVPPGSPSP
jgi:hypothetical protein